MDKKLDALKEQNKVLKKLEEKTSKMVQLLEGVQNNHILQKK